MDDQSFTFENLLPFFQKSPAFTPPDIAKRGPGSEQSYDEAAFSPTGGPLQVSYSNFYQPISSFVQKAFNQLGLSNVPGLHSGKLIGYSEFTYTVDTKAATRSSSETSFLQQALATSNLQVYQRTLAKSIQFDDQNTATGVELEVAGKGFALAAKKEVIVANGVVSSQIARIVCRLSTSSSEHPNY